MSGPVLNCVVFISSPENPWKDLEKETMLNALSQSENWLSAQAQSYQSDLSFKRLYIGDKKDLVFDTIEIGKASGKERVDWVSRVLKRQGYKNAKQAYKRFAKESACSNLQMIIFAKADGMTYAMGFKKGMKKGKYFLEGCLVYQRYDNGAPQPTAGVIAHELLHLYGAWDLYPTFMQTQERYEKARELYPNDIMLRLDHDINFLSIDKLTAWRLGWNKNEEEIFEWFRPQRPSSAR